MRKSLIHLLTTLLIGFLGVMSYLHVTTFWLPFEYKIKDAMLQNRGEIRGSDAIVIIDIDEKSLKALGQWPWSRDVIASMLNNLTQKGVAAIGLDIVFAEPDNSSPKRVLEKMGLPNDTMPDYDAILAQSIGETPTIIGYVFALEPDAIEPQSHPKSNAIVIEHQKPLYSTLIKPYRPILNMSLIEKHAYSSGYFNTMPDSDGVVRSVPLLMQYDDILYPSLGLEIARIVLGEAKIEVQYDDNGISHLRLGNNIIPTDFTGKMLVNYRGSKYAYTYISAVDILENRVETSFLEGKIALVGTSAAGLLDLRSTPFDTVYPGVEVHANAIDNILHQSFLHKPMWAHGVNIISIVFIVFFIYALLLLPSALWSFFLLIVFNALFIGAHYFFMIKVGLIFNTLIPLICLNALFIIGQAINYFLEIRQKERIKHKFASKVSEAVMNDLLAHQSEVLQGKEKEITIFFSDIRNFTTLSERIRDPKHLIHFINTYMHPMSEIIIASQGTVDKYIGDSIMAYWNAPLDVAHHADKALLSALEQLRYLPKLNDQLAQDPLFSTLAQTLNAPLIDIGIGINTGVAIVGEMGSLHRSDYTVIGDTINVGSRLESLCKFYGASLIVSQSTKEALTQEYTMRFLDRITVKGKHEPIDIWQVYDLLSNSDTFLKEELRVHHEAISLYHRALFTEAFALFNALNRRETKSNATIYTLYLERCSHYIAHPPKHFDAVFSHTSKG